MKSRARILVVDDEPDVADILRQALEIGNYTVTTTSHSRKALPLIEEFKPDLVLLDLMMPELDGLQVLAAIQDHKLKVPVVMMTGFSSMETAIKAIRMGAKDYLTKPLNLLEIESLVSKLIDDQAARLAEPVQQDPAAISSRFGMIGSSPAMISVYKIIGAISKTPNASNVLVTGESGVGKELVARQVHNFGDNAKAPYVALNMTALPDNLIESELFGYEKGAFTGATQRVKGHFEEARDGTIFLDEIGGISPNLQQKLLRVLQEREFIRIGGRETIPIHCRIVAATNSDLAALSKKGEFRSDLFHRLNVVNVKIPPLRERVDDIPRLAEYFVQENSRELNRSLPSISNQAIEILCRYDWPGNVRELRNIISRVMILNSSDILQESDFSDLWNAAPTAPSQFAAQDLATARHYAMATFEKDYLISMLKLYRGNIQTASRTAKITPQRFYQLMNKYEMRVDDYKV